MCIYLEEHIQKILIFIIKIKIICIIMYLHVFVLLILCNEYLHFWQPINRSLKFEKSLKSNRQEKECFLSQK